MKISTKNVWPVDLPAGPLDDVLSVDRVPSLGRLAFLWRGSR